MQRAEDGSRRRRKILQFRDIDCQQQQVVECGDSFDALLRGISCDECPWFIGQESGEDAHRNAERDGRTDGARVENLGAEMRQLLRLVIGDTGYDAHVGHLPRVRGKDAGNVRPDLDLPGVEGGAQEGRAVVRTSSPKRGRRAVRGAADEPGEDDSLTSVQMRPHLLVRKLASEGTVGPGVAVPVIGSDNAISPDVDRWYAAGAKDRGKENAHRLLAGGDNAVRIARAELPGTVDVGERVVEGGMELIERGDRGGAFLVVANGGCNVVMPGANSGDEPGDELAAVDSRGAGRIEIGRAHV